MKVEGSGEAGSATHSDTKAPQSQLNQNLIFSHPNEQILFFKMFTFIPKFLLLLLFFVHSEVQKNIKIVNFWSEILKFLIVFFNIDLG